MYEILGHLPYFIVTFLITDIQYSRPASTSCSLCLPSTAEVLEQSHMHQDAECLKCMHMVETGNQLVKTVQEVRGHYCCDCYYQFLVYSWHSFFKLLALLIEINVFFPDLTHKVPITTTAFKILTLFLLFFRDSKA